MKVVAKNRRTGGEYVHAEKIKHAPQLTEVSTLRAWPTKWVVDSRNVKVI